MTLTTLLTALHGLMFCRDLIPLRDYPIVKNIRLKWPWSANICILFIKMYYFSKNRKYIIRITANRSIHKIVENHSLEYQIINNGKVGHDWFELGKFQKSFEKEQVLSPLQKILIFSFEINSSGSNNFMTMRDQSIKCWTDTASLK